MIIRMSVAENILTIILIGNLTIESIKDFRKVLKKICTTNYRTIRFQLKGVDRIDSTGFALISLAMRTAIQNNTTVELIDLSPELKQMLKFHDLFLAIK